MAYIIEFPKCKWCGSGDAHPCEYCGEWTCWECLQVLSIGKCTHVPYTEQPAGWTIIDEATDMTPAQYEWLRNRTSKEHQT